MISVHFRTAARCHADRLAMDFDAVLLGEVRPEDSPAVQIGFLSIASAAEFVRELRLEDVRVLAAPHEDAAGLLADIIAGVTANVH